MNKRRVCLGLFLFVVCFLCQAEDKFLDSGGVKIHYIVEGQGTPVVLVHGFSASAQSNFGGIIKTLAADYQVVALDNRGHGQSDKPHDPAQYGLKMNEDVLRLMDELNIKKAHIVGYSMGGFMVNKLLVDHPERFITATLGGAGFFVDGGFLDLLAGSLDQSDISPLLLFLTPKGAPPPTKAQLDATNKMLLSRNDPAALAAAARGMKAFAVTEQQMKANKIPTLSLIGEVDPLKDGVDVLAKSMSNLKVTVIEGGSHMDAFTKPKFSATLQEFLAAHTDKKKAAGAGN